MFYLIEDLTFFRQVDKQKLFRIYGALMWNLGKIIKTPESLRVYVGTFWDQPLVFDENAALFQAEQRDLMKELLELPRNVVVRKINELVKRIRMVKIHSYLIGHLKDQMPTFGKKKKMENVSNSFKLFCRVLTILLCS